MTLEQRWLKATGEYMPVEFAELPLHLKTRAVEAVERGDTPCVPKPVQRREEADESLMDIEAEALALLDKPPEPSESLDDWVTQDRVPVRPSDERRWVNPDGSVDVKNDWKTAKETGTSVWYPYLRHNDKNETGNRLELRCRRRDLPPLPEQKPATRKVVINRYAVTEDGKHWWIVLSDEAPEYLENKLLGVFEEIEVPL